MFRNRKLEFIRNASLKETNTFRLDVKAAFFIEVNTISQLLYVLESRIYANNKVLILGGGSNVLFTKDFEGLVVKINIKGIKRVYEDDSSVHLRVSAGEDWPALVQYVVSKGWGGIENLALVPGTAGAAPIQNIACYGHNLHESLISVDAVDIHRRMVQSFSVKECKFGYRDSIFKRKLRNKYIIVSILLRLTKKPIINTTYKSRYDSVEEELSRIASRPYDIADVYKAISNIRRRKLPDISKIGSVGSTFKNPTISRQQFIELKKICPGIHYYPLQHLSYSHLENDSRDIPNDEKVKIPAAWLVEDMGWAGKRIGDCGIWEKQPLNIVNYGNATPSELHNFIKLVARAVQDKYGIKLEPEVTII